MSHSGFPGAHSVKNPSAMRESWLGSRVGKTPWKTACQYSCLEHPQGHRSLAAAVHEIAVSATAEQLSTAQHRGSFSSHQLQECLIQKSVQPWTHPVGFPCQVINFDFLHFPQKIVQMLIIRHMLQEDIFSVFYYFEIMQIR